MEISSKKQLAIILTGLKRIESPDFKLEQYPTDPNIAAEILWNAFYRREIEGKVVADLGCGAGILGIGAVLLRAKKVYLVDIDEKALNIAKENLKEMGLKVGKNLDDKCIFLQKNVKDFDENVDVVLQNPPFGIQGSRHADKEFLEKAFKISGIIYSFHKAESKNFLDAITKDNGFKVKGYWEFDWPLKRSMKFHEKNLVKIRVGCWRLEKV